MKEPRLLAIAVDHYFHSWNLRGALPELGLFPVVRKTFGLEEEHIGGKTSLTVRHDCGEFTYASSSTRAVRVSKHDQGRMIRRGSDSAGPGPHDWRCCHRTRSVFVAHKQAHANAGCRQPYKGADDYRHTFEAAGFSWSWQPSLTRPFEAEIHRFFFGPRRLSRPRLEGATRCD